MKESVTVGETERDAALKACKIVKVGLTIGCVFLSSIVRMGATT